MRGRAVPVIALLALAALAGGGCRAAATSRVLRVCADPNNLPFSDRSGQGFENHLAALLASDRGARLEYTWWAQRRGFLRNTLAAARCDVVIGMPVHADRVKTTQPYYRSSYVFVSRAGAGLDITSLADPRLRQLRVGVQLIGDDASNSPPAHALSGRGIVKNVVGYPVFGDYARSSPLAPIVDAVENRDVDIAIVWGPTAGYFARRRPVPLELRPVAPDPAFPALPFAFDIAMAVRPGDAALAAELDDFIGRRRGDIERVLHDYGVPVIKDEGHASATE